MASMQMRVLLLALVAVCAVASGTRLSMPCSLSLPTFFAAAKFTACDKNATYVYENPQYVAFGCDTWLPDLNITWVFKNT